MIFSIVSLASVSFISDLIYMIYLLLLNLGFVCSSFSNSFRCKVRLVIWDFSCSWSKVVSVWTSPLDCFCSVPDLGSPCFHFHLFFFDLFSGLLVIRSIGFGFNMLVFFTVLFFYGCVWLTSNLIAWGCKRYLIRFQFAKILRLVLWLSLCSILVSIPCALEKNVYSAAFGWNGLHLSMMSTSSKVSLNVSLLIFSLDDLSIDMSGVLKASTIIMLLSTTSFVSVNICFIKLSYFSCLYISILLGLIPWWLYKVLPCLL